MMTKAYRFEISGTAADGQTWETKGQITANAAEVHDAAMRESFEQLTGGRAVFGKPGLGCRGPYDVRRILIERIDA